MRVFTREDLRTSDLYIDARYEGGRSGTFGDDPLPDLLGVNNQGGFRYLGGNEAPRLVVLTTNLSDPDWPDELDPETGIFTYYGDNKKPGRGLHETPRFGNSLLRDMFNATHTGNRAKVPVVLVFSNAGLWRDFVFRGLVVPGSPRLSSLEDLVAVWKVSGASRFQNYRAKFTVLDTDFIPRSWLSSLRDEGDVVNDAPAAWLEWVDTGKYRALQAERTTTTRSKKDQLPSTADESAMLSHIRSFFANNPHGFEHCAAELVRISLGKVSSVDVTRPSRDGGRDAIGHYQIGVDSSSISVEFSIEAKCYSEDNSVGVRELSRLISRLRHRQFGVLVTTSWVHSQAYAEIQDDRHPIIIISGADIIAILKTHGIDSEPKLNGWLESHFSFPSS